MENQETLHFKIGLAGNYWDKVPIYSILIDDKILFTKEIATPTGEVDFIEFDVDVAEGPRILKIRLENKTDDQVVKDNNTKEDFVIVKDMLLHIDSIEIDEINLGDLVWKKSTFTGDDTSRPTLVKCVDLGWNGTWALPFESPFYIWLLENI